MSSRNFLLNSIKQNKVGHAYIIEGPEGVGKKTLAREFAAAIHCESENTKPCGVCPSCIKHSVKSHPDYMEIVPEDDKKTLSVRAVREMISDVYIKPFAADKKIYFFPNADECEAAAQNAMLKVFEEPPPFAVIILATKNSSNLLSTIRSRAININLPPWSHDKIRRFITEEYPDYVDKADFVADFSLGLPGRVKTLCTNDDFLQMRAELFNSISKMPTGSALTAYDTADVFIKYKENSDLILDLLISWLRDAMVLKFSGQRQNHDFEKQLTAFCSSITTEGLTRALSKIISFKTGLSKYSNFNLWVIDMLICVWEEINGKGNRR